MAKTTDVPVELREFNKVFQQLEYRWDASSVYHDYLDYCIEVFDITRTGERRERLQERYGKEYQMFPEMFHAHVHTMDKMLGLRDWYDLLGTYYECISSRSKSSALGQFFTPHTLCDLMAGITNAEESKGMGKTVHDPACGSGRTLLAFHTKAPGNYLYGDDLDPMCSKMCAINMVMHAAVGQVGNTNSLSPDDWRFGYDINPQLYPSGIVGLRPLTKEQAYSWQHWESRRLSVAAATAPVTPTPPAVKPPDITVGKNGQTSLNLF